MMRRASTCASCAAAATTTAATTTAKHLAHKVLILRLEIARRATTSLTRSAHSSAGCSTSFSASRHRTAAPGIGGALQTIGLEMARAAAD